MDYNDELPTTTLNCLGNAVLPFLLSLLPSTLEFFTPVNIQETCSSFHIQKYTLHQKRSYRDLLPN
jgi:hypothetical protein